MKRLPFMAMLLAAPSILHAGTVSRLPDAVLGRWCLVDSEHFDGARFERDSKLFGHKDL
jgi:hypothetical protein